MLMIATFTAACVAIARRLRARRASDELLEPTELPATTTRRV